MRFPQVSSGSSGATTLDHFASPNGVSAFLTMLLTTILIFAFLSAGAKLVFWRVYGWVVQGGLKALRSQEWLPHIGFWVGVVRGWPTGCGGPAGQRRGWRRRRFRLSGWRGRGRRRSMWRLAF